VGGWVGVIKKAERGRACVCGVGLSILPRLPGWVGGCKRITDHTKRLAKEALGEVGSCDDWWAPRVRYARRMLTKMQTKLIKQM